MDIGLAVPVPEFMRSAVRWVVRGSMRAARSFDHAHRRATVRANEGGCAARDGCCLVRLQFGRGRNNVQQIASLREMLAPAAIGEQPVVPDTVKATGQDV